MRIIGNILWNGSSYGFALFPGSMRMFLPLQRRRGGNMLLVITPLAILGWIRSALGGTSAMLVARLRGRTPFRVLRIGVSPLPRTTGAFFRRLVQVCSKLQYPGL